MKNINQITPEEFNTLLAKAKEEGRAEVHAHYAQKDWSWCGELAEAQARIKVLEGCVRLALDAFEKNHCIDWCELEQALSTTSPTEALDKVVREAQNEMLDNVAASGLIGKDGELYKSLRRINP